MVVDWKQQPRGNDLRPRITLRDDKDEVIKLANGLEARYFMSVDAILSVDNGVHVKAGDVLARIPRETSKTRDITGGLPRVAELFEARKPKDFAIISDIAGRVEFGKDYKTKRRIVVVPEEDGAESQGVPDSQRASTSRSRRATIVTRGDLLMDGNPVPHDILDVLGVEALAEYLINEIQSVYRLQGVKINDKHIEVIVRQMLQKVEVDRSRRDHLPGRRAGRPRGVRSGQQQGGVGEGGAPAVRRVRCCRASPRRALQTKLLHLGRLLPGDHPGADRGGGPGQASTSLIGLKENVIVGRLIPAGTG